MDFSAKLEYVRSKGWSDIEIAEEVSRISGHKISRQRIFNYRTNRRPNPAVYEVAIAILKLYKRLKAQAQAQPQAAQEYVEYID